MVTKKEIETYIAISESYVVGRLSAERKLEFARIGKKICHSLATLMNLPKGTYNVRFNPGGPAVIGDVILHSEVLYANLSPSCTGAWFYFRTCDGMKDYTGGRNQNCDMSVLRELPKLAQRMLQVVQSQSLALRV